MSDLNTVAQSISAVVSNADNAINIMGAYSKQISEMIALANSTMQGTNQVYYHNLINLLVLTQKKIDYAADCLQVASKSGQEWLREHFISSYAGGYSQNNSNLNAYDSSTTDKFQRPDPSQASNPYMDLVDEIDNNNISYFPFSHYSGERTEKDIIERLGGGDQTDGSCSSLAFAYCGNKAGYDVLDFRDGNSREFFGENKYILRIAELPNVNAKIEWGKDDEACTIRLMDQMEPGKEYYLATGVHAAIVRLNNGRYEYLELQQPKELNGWYPLHSMSLIERFGCDVNPKELPNFLIEVESLSNCTEFLDLLGFINTAESEQNKGDAGYAK